MTENINGTGNTGRRYTAFLAVLYTAVTCADIFAFMNGIYNGSFPAALSAGILVPFATMLLFGLLLLSLGKDAYKGALALLAPTLLCGIYGYILCDYGAAYDAIFSFLTPTIASLAVYLISKHDGSVSYRCAGAAFLHFLMNVLETTIAVSVYASSSGVRFGTVIFDGLGAFVNEFVALYQQALGSAVELYPGIDAQALAASTEYLEETLITTVALSPAIMCAVFFFEIYIFTRLLGAAARLMEIKAETEKFSVSSVTNVIFHICAVLLMFSILFESSISGFTLGVLGVLIFLLPNYLILGARRIFSKLAKFLPRGICIFVMTGACCVGLMLSPYLILLIVTFFGTAEYRASKNTSPLG